MSPELAPLPVDTDDLMVIAARVAKECDRLRPAQVFLDVTGVGGGALASEYYDIRRHPASSRSPIASRSERHGGKPSVPFSECVGAGITMFSLNLLPMITIRWRVCGTLKSAVLRTSHQPVRRRERKQQRFK